MTKFRKSDHDAPVWRTAKSSPPGTIPDGKVQVVDGHGRLRGLVGRGATSATAARFHGQLGSKLGTHNGAPAWIAPKLTLADVSVEGTNPAIPPPKIGGAA